MDPVTANTSGVGFAGQDKVRQGSANTPTTQGTADFNLYHGIAIYDIETIGCGELQAFSKYSHTWEKTEVNSIGIGIDSVSFGWNDEPQKWELASKPSNVVKVKKC